MFHWFKPKSPKQTIAPQQSKPFLTPDQGTIREDLIRDMQKNMQSAKDALGRERLAYLAQLVASSEPPEDVSPRAQAQKILAKMDKEKVAIFLRDIKNTPPTQH